MSWRELCHDLDSLLQVDAEAAELGVRVAYTVSWGEAIKSVEALDREVEKLVEELRSRYTLDSLRNDPIVRAYRDFYWRIGVDPTKTRPSSEALVRRALRGKFPRIHPVVDAGNIASARTMVPIGLYDCSKLKAPLRLTVSRGGEVFEPIGGSPEQLDEGLPILVDSKRVVLHVYPHRDSRKTMVTEETGCVIVVGAGVPGVEVSLVVKAVEEVVKMLSLLGWSWCGRISVAPRGW